jgi:low affinity Fe/Cu permease
MPESKKQDLSARFGELATRAAGLVGSPWAFLASLLTVLLWGATGPRFHYSDTWQLVINTGTTIVTFLMVFLIQNTQNRDARAIHLKLDEVIRSIHDAHNEMINIETLSDRELAELATRYQKFKEQYEKRKGKKAAEEALT